MTPTSKKGLPASIRARLLMLAKTRGEDFDLVLKRFGIERLLYRLNQSKDADAFVLKGAMLFELWMGKGHRSTKDLDLLGFGPREIPRLEAVFRELCVVEVEPDGLVFLPKTVKGEEIREDSRYQGIRITLQALLATARISLQVDIGFGDAVFPAPEPVEYPSLLGLPRPRLRAYPREAVIAEKFHAMVALGLVNSRLKDYFDIWTILRMFKVDRANLRTAIHQTFERRHTAIPQGVPIGLSQEFATDALKMAQWRAVLQKADQSGEFPLAQVVQELRDQILPVLRDEDG